MLVYMFIPLKNVRWNFSETKRLSRLGMCLRDLENILVHTASSVFTYSIAMYAIFIAK